MCLACVCDRAPLFAVQLARGNLIAHRERNRKTTIMYSVSLAFIVFIAVAANQQLQTQLYSARQSTGVPIAVRARLCRNPAPFCEVCHVHDRLHAPRVLRRLTKLLPPWSR